MAWVIGAIILIWVILWIYVVLNEEKLINKVSSAIHERTRGDVQIKGLSVSFFRTFPLLSLQLTDVVLKDSTYPLHHRNLLSASDVYLRVSVPGLIMRTSPVGRVLIRNGEINVFVDSLGNNNRFVFKSGQNKSPGKDDFIPDIVLKNVAGRFEDTERNKHYYALFHTLKASATKRNGQVRIDMNMRVLVRNLAFNTIKGAYLKEKLVEGKFKLIYNKESKEVTFNRIRLDLDNHPYYFTGKFNVEKENGNFNLDISTRNVQFSKASSLLTDQIRKKLDQYSIIRPVSFTVKLSGKTLKNSNPLVQVNMNIKNNKVITPQGMFEDCSLTAFYSNNLDPGKRNTDENSYLQFTNFRGRWERILIRSKSIRISNLIKPFLECDLSSDVDMQSLNNLAASSTLQFLKGKTTIDIDFKGPVNGDDSVVSNINGTIKIFNASIKYLPRNLLMSDCDGTLKFVNNDLLVNKLNATIGKTRLVMNGSAKNFLSMLNVSPEKLILNWEIYTPELHLSDFKHFLTQSETKKENKKNAKFGEASSRIDKMFAGGDVVVSLQTPVMDYKTFRATNVKAKVVLTPTDIKLEAVALNHAGGSMNMNGLMKNGVKENPVMVHVIMQNMDIPLLFSAFNNFGQDAITNKNLKGKLSADLDFHSAITNQADLVTAANVGSIRFLLTNGELNNFEPLREISKKAFKKQDFTEIRFADLKNKLDVKGSTFIVNPMDIRSTALNFFVEGVYDIKKGTDMSIRLPLRNLTKSQANTDISDGGKAKKGVSLRLRAKTGDDGKLKVTWDPFRLAVKNKQDVKDSTDLKN